MWTPVGLHPNCKKHLKSAKVDAEYNLPTGVPKASNQYMRLLIYGEVRVGRPLAFVPTALHYKGRAEHTMPAEIPNARMNRTAKASHE
jgi:hypothetical protein